MYFGARRCYFGGVHEGWGRQAFTVGCLPRKEGRSALWTVQTLSNSIMYGVHVHKAIFVKTSDIF